MRHVKPEAYLIAQPQIDYAEVVFDVTKQTLQRIYAE